MTALSIVRGIARACLWLHIIADSKGWKGLWLGRGGSGVAACIIVVTSSYVSKPIRQAMEAIRSSEKPQEARANLQQVCATRKLFKRLYCTSSEKLPLMKCLNCQKL